MMPFEVSHDDVSGVVIALSQRSAGVVTGMVRTPTRAADAVAVVVVFPTDPRRWIDNGVNPRDVRVTRVSGAGTYAFHGLPDGEYHLAAITALDADRWRDAEFLASLVGRARTVSAKGGSTVTQDLESGRR